ncbi:MFS transporter [Hoyosella subflava]|uniref:Major facilitator superfamily transporter protein n=1 Tax=Hoyosella subflava (strain DSM 45089 / JCM 17490 / NBRC 109087 / DQS3-9A1) TaxID=443218 RepID=F6EGL2_HOYSD|nr:MFS transporter [Hoyosella subflava]AEF41065.1 Major facilitator superfamily transporter protein [Hoyosella subflava DQS3-9A1]
MTKQAEVQRRTLLVLVIAQVLSGAGLAAGITVGALLAEDVLGSTSLAGVPAALFTVGAAGAAYAVGQISQRWGRRAGLASGYAAGALGSGGVVIAAVAESLPLLTISLLIYGSGLATNLQARYAGADLAEPARRGSAISIVMVATTAGAVAGPNTVTVSGDIASHWGIPPLAGPFMLATLAYGLASLVLYAGLRPDPLLLAREIAAAASESAETGAVRAPRLLASGAAVMTMTQLVMIAIMTMTPIHMLHHGHSLGAAGVVIAVHVAAMYLPSPVSGMLVDRFGARLVAVAAGVTLIAAGGAAATSDSVAGLIVALALLGLGWNLGLISGTTMITNAAPIQQRARIQGGVDLGIALAGAGGGFASGFIVASTSYSVLALGGAIIAACIVPLLAFRSVADKNHSERKVTNRHK